MKFIETEIAILLVHRILLPGNVQENGLWEAGRNKMEIMRVI